MHRLLLVFAVLVFSVTHSGAVTALSDEQRRLLDSGALYFNAVGSLSCQTAAGALGGTNDGTIYRSGLQGPYILEQFMIHLLKRLAQKYNKPESETITEEHVIALVAFALGEGGDINNRSIFNPMNLSYKAADLPSSPYAVDGVDGRQSYASFDVGVEAYARQMSSGYQSRLGYALSQPSTTADQFMYALTYYNQYEGNQFWASASLNDPAAYYRQRLNLVNTVRKNYGPIAGLIIGTPAFEQREGMINTSLITYQNLVTDQQRLISGGNLGAISDPCVAGPGTGIAAIASIAEREYNKNRGIKEYGGTILEYTSGRKEPWCADFLSWVYKESGNPLTKGLSPDDWQHASVLELQAYMKKYHIYFAVGEQDPQPGDIAFYIGAQTPDGGSTQHANIVYAVDKATGTMITIGGNESDQILKTSRKIQLDANSLVGFGRITK